MDKAIGIESGSSVKAMRDAAKAKLDGIANRQLFDDSPELDRAFDLALGEFAKLENELRYELYGFFETVGDAGMAPRKRRTVGR